MLADLANAYRLNGDNAAALSTVDQAIMVATERHARVAECLARIVRAKVLLQSTIGDEKIDGDQEMDLAKTLIRETGAVVFEAFIDDVGFEHSNARQIPNKAS